MKLGGGKEWFTAAELAELKLPGLPKGKRKINEDWAPGWALRINAAGAPMARTRAGRGGGMEYHFGVLPAAARSALVKLGVAVLADVTNAPPQQRTAADLWRWYDAQSDATKAKALHRLKVIQSIELRESLRMTRTHAIAAAAAQFGHGKTQIQEWLNHVAGIDPANRLPCLAPRYVGGGKKADVHPDVWQMFRSDYLRPKVPLSAAYRRTVEFCEANGHPIPSERTLRRKVEAEVDGRVIALLRDGDEAMKKVIPQQKRSVAGMHAMHTVNIDGHTWDVMVQWPDGRIGRPIMVAIQDVYSRKILAWRIDESESALATRLVFADLFETWGIPKAVVMDNGRAFASKAITGGAKSRFRFKIREDEPTGILTALDIKIIFATPYHGQAKPIERAFRDLEGSTGWHPAFHGANTGNSPTNKPHNYGDRAIPVLEFEAAVANGIAEHNRRLGRKTEMANGRSFDQVFAESYAVAPIGKATEEHLRLALLTAENRRCNPDNGEVTLDDNRYHAEELYAWRGKRVTVRFDPDDLHSEVHVYTHDGRFICTAPLIAASPFDSRAAAQDMAKKRKMLRAHVRELARLENLLSPDQVAAALAGPQSEAAPIEPSVVRPVRHRGQTAAALKLTPEAVETPLSTPVIDRLAGLRLIDGGLGE